VLIHGTQDENVPYEISARYLQRARAFDDPAELVTLPNTGHFEVIAPRSHAWPAVLAAVQRLLCR
jgi:dipeptidyl aminopeptidase/acylaminoacyl peptidase